MKKLSAQQSERLLTVSVGAAMLFVVAAIAAGAIFLSRQLGPSCLDNFLIPNPGLAIVIFVDQLDQEEPQFNVNEAIASYGWMVADDTVKMYVENGDSFFYGEPCFHEETMEFENIEILPISLS